MSTTIISVNIEKVHQLLSDKYVEDFGKLDDRFYFMSGFVSTTLIEENIKKVKKNEVPLGGIELSDK